VPPAPDPGEGPTPPSLFIPEIRDYQRINADLANLLDQGHPRIRLEGAEGQRLLVAGLAGPWHAVVEVDGRTGPELAAGLDAPHLVVVARGATADGVGLGLRSGVVLVLGAAGDAAGYGQSGGVLVVDGPAGHRAGLAQSGGILALLGPAGRLAGDRQTGGHLFAPLGAFGPHAGRGRRGGRLVEGPTAGPLDPDAARAWREARAAAAPWVDLAAGVAL